MLQLIQLSNFILEFYTRFIKFMICLWVGKINQGKALD